MHTAQAQTYDPHAVEVINNLIANNGLQATPDAPETWDWFATWNDETPKQIIELQLEQRLSGNASFSGLTTLFDIRCEDGKLTKLDFTNCAQLTVLRCCNNLLSEINITGCAQIGYLVCYKNALLELDLSKVHPYFLGHDQYPSPLTLYKNESEEYTCTISLNNPVFGNSAISYEKGILTSIDSTITSTSFAVQTGYENLTGTMRFIYSDSEEIRLPEIKPLKIYPNPSNDTLFIECEDFLSLTIKIYNMQGKEILSQNVEGKPEINISHLPDGVYIVNAISKDKIIESIKIVKQ